MDHAALDPGYFFPEDISGQVSCPRDALVADGAVSGKLLIPRLPAVLQIADAGQTVEEWDSRVEADKDPDPQQHVLEVGGDRAESMPRTTARKPSGLLHRRLP